MWHWQRYLFLMGFWLVCALVFEWIDTGIHALWPWWYASSDYWQGYLMGGEVMLLLHLHTYKKEETHA